MKSISLAHATPRRRRHDKTRPPTIALWVATPGVFVLSALWHQLYDWLPAVATAWVAPVAESVWEHAKIVWYPTLVYWWVVWWTRRGHGEGVRLWYIATVQAAVGVGGMLALYYAAHAGLGIGQVLWVDLACEGVALGLGAVAAKHWTPRRTTALHAVALGLVWGTMAALLALLTYYYPAWPLFARLE